MSAIADTGKDRDHSDSHHGGSSSLGSEDPLDRDWLSKGIDRLAASIDTRPTASNATAEARTNTSAAAATNQYQFTVVTWNLWFSQHEWQARLEAAIAQTLRHDPDVICYQEVTTDVHSCMLRCQYLRDRYVPTEERLPCGYDCAIWVRKDSPALSRRFSWRCSAVDQNAMQSIYGRRGLCVDLEINSDTTASSANSARDGANTSRDEHGSHPTYRIRVMTAHLESGRGMTDTRHIQLDALFAHIREMPWSASGRGSDTTSRGGAPPAIDASFLVGDFNLDPSYPENALVDANGIDLWKALRPAEEAGFTEDTYKNRMRYLAHGKHKQVRYDRVVLVPTFSGDDSVARQLQPLGIELLGTEPFDREGQIWVSDHFGLAARVGVGERKKLSMWSENGRLVGGATTASSNANDGYETP